jgi:hypothetical protein
MRAGVIVTMKNILMLSARENQEVSSMAQMGISVKTALDHPSSVENVLCWVCVENSS